MLRTSFDINFKTIFQLIMTRDNIKNTENAVIQRNSKKRKIQFFVKNADINKDWEGNIIFVRFLKSI